jgi:hypothetical protein
VKAFIVVNSLPQCLAPLNIECLSFTSKLPPPLTFDLSSNLLQTFNDPTPTTEDIFGRRVALEGNNVLIGANADDTNGIDVGQAHLFTVQLGDYDDDLDVDGMDFLKWQQGESPNPLNAADLTDWEAYYGTVTPLSATSTGVPEPETGIMLLLGIATILTGVRAVVSKPIR